MHLIELVYDFGDNERTSEMDPNSNATYEVVQSYAHAYIITLLERVLFVHIQGRCLAFHISIVYEILRKHALLHRAEPFSRRYHELYSAKQPPIIKLVLLQV